MGRLGESIAVLDGFDLSSMDVSPDGSDGRIGQVRAGVPGYFGAYDPSPDSADGRIGQTRAFPNQYVTEIMPDVLRKLNVIDPSGGANYSGGSSFAPGTPLMPSTVGLAGLEGRFGRRVKRFVKAHPAAAAAALLGLGNAHPAYGNAGLGNSHPAYGNAGLGNTHPAYGNAGLGAGCACGTAADADLAAAFGAYDPSPDSADGRIGQTRAFPNQYVKEIMPDVLQKLNVIDPAGGANYGGGSSFSPGMPLMPSTVGLAAFQDQSFVNYMNAENGRSGPIPNVLPNKVNVIGPSGGANYTGGSSFSPGMPLLVSSAGLAELSFADALDRQGPDRFNGKLGPDARALFQKLAGKPVMASLRAQIALARATRNIAQLNTLGRQLAIARRLRRAIYAYPVTQGVMNAAALSQLAQQVSAQVASAPSVAVA